MSKCASFLSLSPQSAAVASALGGALSAGLGGGMSGAEQPISATIARLRTALTGTLASAIASLRHAASQRPLLADRRGRYPRVRPLVVYADASPRRNAPADRCSACFDSPKVGGDPRENVVLATHAASVVGCQDDVLESRQRIVGWQRLVGVDVEAGPRDPAAPECVDQRRLVGRVSPTGVQKVGRRLHEPKLARSEALLVLLVVGYEGGHEVGLAE